MAYAGSNPARRTMKWFEKNPASSRSVVTGLNKKYGNFDPSLSSRSLYTNQFRKVINSEINFAKTKTVIVGGNNGYESEYLKGNPKELYIVDLAIDALKKVKKATPIFASAEELPFFDGYFDNYLAFRTLFSKHTDLIRCIKEAKRILKKGGSLAVSIPNGYLVNGKIVRGVFNYDENIIETNPPYLWLRTTLSLLNKNKFRVIKWTELPAEIVIFAKR